MSIVYERHYNESLSYTRDFLRYLGIKCIFCDFSAYYVDTLRGMQGNMLLDNAPQGSPQGRETDHAHTLQHTRLC